jgi:hypothetical protein
MRVSIGVDSHKGSLAAAAVDELGRVLAADSLSNLAEKRCTGDFLVGFDLRDVGEEVGSIGQLAGHLARPGSATGARSGARLFPSWGEPCRRRLPEPCR